MIIVPTGCKVIYDGKKSFSMGHLERENHIKIVVNEDVWKMDMSRILPLLNVQSKVNESALWADDEKDELFIEEKLENT